jgi:hypothetical protein
VGAFGHEGTHDVPHLIAATRIEAGGWLVQEDQIGSHDDARRDVEPSAHPARVGLDPSRRRFGDVESLEQLLAALPRSRARESEQSSEQREVLDSGEVLVDGCELAGHADARADSVAIRDDVVPEHAG